MDTVKHTPGPWFEEDGFIFADDGSRVADPRCMVAEPDNMDAMDANARLIAAAPDLLAACEQAQSALSTACHLFDKLLPGWRQSYRFGEIADECAEAIARATAE